MGSPEFDDHINSEPTESENTPGDTDAVEHLIYDGIVEELEPSLQLRQRINLIIEMHRSLSRMENKLTPVVHTTSQSELPKTPHA